jgi:YVTN family beta-propeller protein
MRAYGIGRLALGLCLLLLGASALPAKGTVIATVMAQPAAQSAAATNPIDFDYFKTRVQPIFLAKRPGHARCISCHAGHTPMPLQRLSPGSAGWTDDESRKNFESVRRMVVPGSLKSKLLIHPLETAAGGDLFHNGGKHWSSQSDPEWQTLAAWVRGEQLAAPLTAANGNVRIIQTNSAGDNVQIIDPLTNKVVGEITGIDVSHGVAVAPGGRQIYVSSESDSTLDVVDGRTLKVTKRIALTDRPNNIAIGRDGTRVYVSIAEAPGSVDVIDTVSQTRVKTIPVNGAVHNTYVTPDGRYIVAGSIVSKTITVIDARTEQPAWSLEMDLGIRPMAFATNADGSTRWIFVQLTGVNGFAVVDFQTRKEINRIALPPLPAGKAPFLVGGNESHGMAITPDGRTIVVNSRLNSALYAYSLPDLKLLGEVEVGSSPDWVTLTPDGRTAYVANAASNSVSVVDIKSLKEVTRIPVGQVPKRNLTAVLP